MAPRCPTALLGSLVSGSQEERLELQSLQGMEPPLWLRPCPEPQAHTCVTGHSTSGPRPNSQWLSVDRGPLRPGLPSYEHNMSLKKHQAQP